MKSTVLAACIGMLLAIAPALAQNAPPGNPTNTGFMAQQPGDRLASRLVGLNALTLNWLTEEGYTRTLPGIAPQKLVLSEKGLRALNAVPPSIGKPVGSHLSNLSRQSSVSQIADAVGSFIGGVAKSMSGP